MSSTLTLQIILDLAAAAILLISVISGVKKGFIKTVYSAVRLILCLILTRILYPYAAQILMTTSVPDTIREAVGEKISGLLPAAGSNAEKLENLPLPDFLKEMLIKQDTAEIYAKLGVDTFEQYLTASVTKFAVNAVAVISVLILAIIVTWIVGLVLNLASKLPVIHSVNAFLGGAIGLVLGIILVWIGGAVIYVLILTGDRPQLVEALNASYLLKFANQYNPILGWVTRLLGRG